MSNNNSNNCAGGGGNVSSGTISIGAGGGGGTSTSGGYITWTVPNTWIGPITINPPEEAAPATKKSAKSDGCTCKKCKEYYPYAEPNQEDGTLVCYGCRTRW